MEKRGSNRAARLAGIGGAAAHDFRLGKRTVTIGSDPKNDIVLTHHTVSQRHASVKRWRGRYYLSDLGSTNGSFVNGRRIDGVEELPPGVEVRFGALRFAFLDPWQAERSKQPGISPRTAIELIVVLLLLSFATMHYMVGHGGAEQMKSLALGLLNGKPQSVAPVAAARSAE